MDILNEIDNYIFEKSKEVDIYQVLNPINAKSEHEKFLNCFKSGIKYNPEYKYEVENKNYKIELNKIREYKLYLKNKTDYISQKLYVALDELEQRIKLLDYIGDSDYITKYSQKIYGFPSKDLINKAKDILNQEHIIQEQLEFNADNCKELFEKRLKGKNFENWKIVINEKQLSKVNVNPEKQIININKNANFSKQDINRLIIHEIGTHALRSQNGSYQPYKIFSTILEKDLYTEEGLATINEESKNTLNIRTFRIYAGRVLAVYESLNKSFYEVFTEMQKYFSLEDALYIVSRTKRGIKNTANKGSFVKDYVYLYGYYKVKEFIKKHPIEDLYIGAIGIDEVDECKKLIESHKLIKPKITIENFN